MTAVLGTPHVTQGLETSAGGAASPAAIIAWLHANPGFLAENPALYRMLAPPVRVHGEILADHMAAIVDALRQEAASLLASSRARALLVARVNQAVLALLRTADPLEAVHTEWPGLLGVDAVSFCTETPCAGARTLPPGTVKALLGGRKVMVRALPRDCSPLHGEAAALAAYDALIAVPLSSNPALLALAARDAGSLNPAVSSAELAFLGSALAAAID